MLESCCHAGGHDWMSGVQDGGPPNGFMRFNITLEGLSPHKL